MAHNHSMQASTNGQAKPSSACQCHPPSADTCCELMCFERPNYFCGHMLTDRDLMLEQRYVREKNKLYHRTLDGHGIVCGLRITCNHDCPGEILVEEGYAIDNCGNDLVVCDTARFDVIQRLKEKGLLIEEPKRDPCELQPQEPRCDVTQCFHITICYKEKESDFTTPFVAGCTSGLSECEPTRIREDVWFDVVEELPEELDWIDKLEQRIRTCFELFTHSQFGTRLQATSSELSSIVKGEDNKRADCVLLFCELRSLFLLYLRKHPDKYNCNLERDILQIAFPEQDQNASVKSCRDAICELLKMAWQHVMACVLGEFLPQCEEPAVASCIALGTVEVRNGMVVHVCNCPRTYIQSYERVTELFVTTVISQLACEHPEETQPGGNAKSQEQDNPCKKRPHEQICCADFAFDCRCFVDRIVAGPDKLVDAVVEVLRKFRRDRSAFAALFDFTKSCKVTDADTRSISQIPKSAYKGRIMMEIPARDSEEKERLAHLLAQPMSGLLDLDKPTHFLKLKGGPIVSAFQPHGMEAVMQAQIDTLHGQISELHKLINQLTDTSTKKDQGK